MAIMPADDLGSNKKTYAKAGKCFFILTFYAVESFKYFFIVSFINANPKILCTKSNGIIFCVEHLYPDEIVIG
jgi:arginine exporter protein ArgO